MRDIVDWNYYKERLGNAIQKIITIPAAMQKVPNPVPRIRHPDWLHKKVAEKDDVHKQKKLDDMFADANGKDSNYYQNGRAKLNLNDLEDIGNTAPMNVPNVFGQSAGISKIDIEEKKSNVDPDSTNENIASERVEDGNTLEEEKTRAVDKVASWGNSRQESFAQWLSERKASWRKCRTARKRRRETSMSGSRNPKMKRTNGLEDLFAQQAMALSSSTWQIISFVPTRKPGIYKMWAAVQGRMHSVEVNVPRVFYVETNSPYLPSKLRDLGSLVKRILPEGSEGIHTYQVVMDEAFFKDYLPHLESLITLPQVRGVYENRIPLSWNASITIGCVACIDPVANFRSLGDVFNLADFQPRSIVETSEGYFSEGGQLGYMILHATDDLARGRGMYALHLPSQSRCYIWVVNPATRSQKEVNMHQIERYWREARDSLLIDLGDETDIDCPPPATIEVRYTKSFEKALKSVNTELKTVQGRFSGANVLLIDAPNIESLKSTLPVLDNFSWAEMKTSQADQYPSLGWQLHATRMAIERLVAAPEWLKLRLQAARYAHLPLSSIGEDWVIDACDTLFARQLRDGNHLLWLEDDCEPEISGRPYDVAEALILQGSHKRLELTWPGAYRSVCFEVKVSHLAVCAILEAATLGELEGSALLEENRVFKVLRSLAQNWVDDATRRHNICADTLLRNMYRWICNPASRMYSANLKTIVQSLMRKLLLRLVADLKRLGTTVIYADTSTLILCTGRHSMIGAIGYTDYVLETLRKREIFQWLALSPSRAWHTLLFADRFNYLGLSAALPGQLATSMSQNPGDLASGKLSLQESEFYNASRELEITEESLKAPEFDFVMNMRDYLPEALHNAFMSAVGEFVWMPWKETVTDALAAAKEAAAAGECSADNGIGACADGDLSGLADAQQKWLASALPTKFTEKLLKAVKHISLHVSTHDGLKEHEFPHLAGSHLSQSELGTPALAFIRGITRLYSLDKSVLDQVVVLRRQLLRLVHVKEFGPDAAWRDPCMTVILPDVICSTCQDCQDLDLCRDPALNQHDWRCGACGTQRDVATLEARLVNYLRGMEDSYQLQDLRCQKCRTVTTEHLRRQCDVCSGSIQTSIDAKSIRAKVEVLRNIAEYHSMDVLKELSEMRMVI